MTFFLDKIGVKNSMLKVTIMIVKRIYKPQV